MLVLDLPPSCTKPGSGTIRAAGLFILCSKVIGGFQRGSGIVGLWANQLPLTHLEPGVRTSKLVTQLIGNPHPTGTFQ